MQLYRDGTEEDDMANKMLNDARQNKKDEFYTQLADIENELRHYKELLMQADIVVTNPPFSLFREYVAQLVQFDKKFLILVNKNLITKKEIFPLFSENRVWLGATPMTREIDFDVPKEYIADGLAKKKDRTIILHNGKYMARSPSIWYTNLDHIVIRRRKPA